MTLDDPDVFANDQTCPGRFFKNEFILWLLSFALGHSLLQRDRGCEALSSPNVHVVTRDMGQINTQKSSEITILENKPGRAW